MLVDAGGQADVVAEEVTDGTGQQLGLLAQAHRRGGQLLHQHDFALHQLYQYGHRDKG